jgi:2-polyprenyl-6-methoxyphenol hydroxylase-like FAD-dependent oxidoreductase
MATRLTEKNGGRVLEVAVSGTLTHEDYRHFIPAFERLVMRHGKIRVLFEMTDFHGWEAAALWDDIKFDVKQAWSIGRVVLVGDACQCVSPLAGQGASMALTAAYTLAEELDAHGNVRQALARYEERLKPAIERQQAAGRRIAKWFVPDDTPHRIVRDLATRMSTWPGIAGLLRSRMAAESVLGRL